jgi:hypothetical protein
LLVRHASIEALWSHAQCLYGLKWEGLATRADASIGVSELLSSVPKSARGINMGCETERGVFRHAQERCDGVKAYVHETLPQT